MTLATEEASSFFPSDLTIKIKKPILSQQHSLSSEQHSPDSNSTAASSLGRSPSIAGPDTPLAAETRYQGLHHQRLVRRSSKGRHPSSEDGAALLRTSAAGGQLSSPAITATTSSSSSSNSSRPSGLCQPSLQTRIIRRLAWSASVLQRQASCPASVQQLQYCSFSGNSSTPRMTGDQQPLLQQQQQQQPNPCSNPSRRLLRLTRSTPCISSVTAAAAAASSALAKQPQPEAPSAATDTRTTMTASAGSCCSLAAPAGTQQASAPLRAACEDASSTAGLNSSAAVRPGSSSSSAEADSNFTSLQPQCTQPKLQSLPQQEEQQAVTGHSTAATPPEQLPPCTGSLLSSPQQVPPPAPYAATLLAAAWVPQQLSPLSSSAGGTPACPPCPAEITPWEEEVAPGELSTQSSPQHGTARRSSSPDSCSSDTPATCPECLFLPSRPTAGDDFTTTLHNSSAGQKVAVVRVGGAITAVFIKEQSGEVWECSPNQITFPSSTSGSTHAAAAAAGSAPPTSAHSAAGARVSTTGSTTLTAEAAHKLYRSLNRSSSSLSRGGAHNSSSGAGSHSAAGGRGSLGGCGHRSGSSAGSISRGGTHRDGSTGGGSNGSGRKGSSPGSHLDLWHTHGHDTHAAADASAAALGYCCSQHTPCSVGQHQHQAADIPTGKRGTEKGSFSIVKGVKKLVVQWQQRRLERQQRRAAAYVEGLDDAARKAVRLAGCQSFILPHHWTDGAKREAREQRRLRVILAAYRV